VCEQCLNEHARTNCTHSAYCMHACNLLVHLRFRFYEACDRYQAAKHYSFVKFIYLLLSRWRTAPQTDHRENTDQQRSLSANHRKMGKKRERSMEEIEAELLAIAKEEKAKLAQLRAQQKRQNTQSTQPDAAVTARYQQAQANLAAHVEQQRQQAALQEQQLRQQRQQRQQQASQQHPPQPPAQDSCGCSFDDIQDQVPAVTLELIAETERLQQGTQRTAKAVCQVRPFSLWCLLSGASQSQCSMS